MTTSGTSVACGADGGGARDEGDVADRDRSTGGVRARAASGARLVRADAPAAALLAALAAVAFALGLAVPSVSPLLWAVALGAAAAPIGRLRAAPFTGVRNCGGLLLRTGVALLGLQVSLDQLADVGFGGLLLAAGTVIATLLLTLQAARLLRVSPELALLIATGSAICGASAIVAMNAVTRAGEEHVAYAIATVTVFGTVAMLALPPAAALLGLSGGQAGLWAGASIHEVAQVTAAGGAVSAAALELATLVKLARVMMLAPVVAIAAAVGSSSGRPAAGGALPVPPFVVGFLALVAARSLLPLPDSLVEGARLASTILLAAALVALGMNVRLRALRTAGARPLLLGALATLVASATALALVLVLP